ncbi:MAG: TlpA disulfide reductase family protein [Opitutaceae bacterium]
MSRLKHLLLGLALGMTGAALAGASVKVGDVFPELRASGVVDLGGGDLPAVTGKVVLVDFWASWCAPCKASFGMLAKLQRDYGPRGLVIAAVSVDEKPASAKAFVKKLAPPFSPLHDAAQMLAQQVVVPAMPTSYLMGPDGRISAIHQGFHGEPTERELRRQIEALLNAAPTSHPSQ